MLEAIMSSSSDNSHHFDVSDDAGFRRIAGSTEITDRLESKAKGLAECHTEETLLFRFQLDRIAGWDLAKIGGRNEDRDATTNQGRKFVAELLPEPCLPLEEALAFVIGKRNLQDGPSPVSY